MGKASLQDGFKERGLSIHNNGNCDLCHDEKEDVNHCLISCFLSQQVWAMVRTQDLEIPLFASIQNLIDTCVTYLASEHAISRITYTG